MGVVIPVAVKTRCPRQERGYDESVGRRFGFVELYRRDEQRPFPLRLVCAGIFERLEGVVLSHEEVDRLVVAEFNERPGAHGAEANSRSVCPFRGRSRLPKGPQTCCTDGGGAPQPSPGFRAASTQ